MTMTNSLKVLYSVSIWARVLCRRQGVSVWRHHYYIGDTETRIDILSWRVVLWESKQVFNKWQWQWQFSICIVGQKQSRKMLITGSLIKPSRAYLFHADFSHTRWSCSCSLKKRHLVLIKKCEHTNLKFFVHRYTSGKPVEGRVKVTAKVDPWYPWYDRTLKEQPTLNLELRVGRIKRKKKQFESWGGFHQFFSYWKLPRKWSCLATKKNPTNFLNVLSLRRFININLCCPKSLSPKWDSSVNHLPFLKIVLNDLKAPLLLILSTEILSWFHSAKYNLTHVNFNKLMFFVHRLMATLDTAFLWKSWRT